MSRVLAVTVTRRSAALGLVVLATGLAACGSQESDGGSGAAAAGATTPAATIASAPTSTPKFDGTGDTAPDGTKYRKITAARGRQLTDYLESSTTTKAASTTRIPQSAITADSDELIKSLKASGLSPKRSTPQTQAADGTATTVIAGDIRVLLYPSVRDAAVQARNYQQLVNLRPGFSRVDRVGNHIWLYIKRGKLYTQQDLKTYRQIRDRAEKAV